MAAADRVASALTRNTMTRAEPQTLGTYCESYCRPVTNTVKGKLTLPAPQASRSVAGPSWTGWKPSTASSTYWKVWTRRWSRRRLGSIDGGAVDLLDDAALPPVLRGSELVEPLARQALFSLTRQRALFITQQRGEDVEQASVGTSPSNRATDVAARRRTYVA